jgi:hypothetical protein
MEQTSNLGLVLANKPARKLVSIQDPAYSRSETSQGPILILLDTRNEVPRKFCQAHAHFPEAMLLILVAIPCLLPFRIIPITVCQQ